jgi:hypothetical protein
MCGLWLADFVCSGVCRLIGVSAATFTAPEEIGTEPKSVLWMLPLAMSIAVVYKVTKVQKIKAGNFIKEALVLFGSIVVFIIVSAVVLWILAWLITE